MLPDYQVSIYHPSTGALIQVFDATAFHELRYARVLNDIGALVITLSAEDGQEDLFPLDALVEIKRTSPLTGKLTVEDTFFARMTHRFRTGNDERFLVGGLSLNHLLSRRIIDPADDPNEAGGFSTKAGTADAVMRAYALEQGGQNTSMARRFQNFTVATVAGAALGVGRRLRYENLFKIMQEIAEQSLIDFHITRVSGNHLQLNIGIIGSDKTKDTNYPVAPFVLITPARGNMADPSLMIDRRKEQNFVYALAQGAGENRRVYQLAGDGLSDSPWNRIEFTEDIRTAERGSILQAYTQARDKLQETRKTIEFSFEIGGGQPGNIYRLDWDVGDKISAEWGGLIQDLRIKGVEITINQTGETIQVTTEIL